MSSSFKALALILGCAIYLATTAQLRADSVTLNSVNPTSTVDMSWNGIALAPPFTNGDYYAGLMNWTDSTPTPSKVYQTYCIDINHDVTLGGTFTLTPGYSLSSDPTLTANPNTIGALYYLLNAVGLSPSDGVAAAESQVAVWDVIYNNGSTGNSGPLQFSADGSGLTTTQINKALNLASTAWTNQLNSPVSDVTSYAAMLIDSGGSGQAQVYIGTPGAPVPTPLPASLPAGLILFALIGTCGLLRYRQQSRVI